MDMKLIVEKLAEIESKLNKVESGRIALDIINDLMTQVSLLEEEKRIVDKIRDLVCEKTFGPVA